jgi:hypothetical protein
MKQISEEEERPFTSSLNICPNNRGGGKTVHDVFKYQSAVKSGGDGRRNASPLHNQLISQQIRGYII